MAWELCCAGPCQSVFSSNYHVYTQARLAEKEEITHDTRRFRFALPREVSRHGMLFAAALHSQPHGS